MLSRLAHQGAAGPDGTVAISATHEELSTRSGVSHPKLSQELGRLELADRLKLERGSIRIIDLTDLFDPTDWRRTLPSEIGDILWIWRLP
jgi:hypothetical protein